VTRRVASAKQGGQPDRYTDERFVGLGPSDHDFAGADLTRCAFQRDDLSGADLRGARGYVISPLDNDLGGMRVALPEAMGLIAALGVVVE